MLAFVGISLSTASLAKIRSACCSAALAFASQEAGRRRYHAAPPLSVPLTNNEKMSETFFWTCSLLDI